MLLVLLPLDGLPAPCPSVRAQAALTTPSPSVTAPTTDADYKELLLCQEKPVV